MNLYIETVCAMLGARLDVARPCALQGLSIVFSCAVCNKDKVGAKTLWGIKRNIDMTFTAQCLVSWTVIGREDGQPVRQSVSDPHHD